MQLDWMLHPLTIYAFVGIGLAGLLVLFVSAKRQVQRVKREAEAARALLESEIRNLASGMESLRDSVENAPPPPAPTVTPGMNLTRRSQALRMSRRGEPLASIAAALQTPRNEIELMLKVSGLLETPPA